METLTLEELKQKNAQAETEVVEEPKAETEEVEVVAGEEEAVETEEESASSEEETAETDPEPWMLSDEQGSQDGNAVPVAKHAQMRSKLKGKISERDNEIEQLRAEIESLKQAPQPVQNTTVAPRPKLEDFEYDESKYNEALDDWYDAKLEAKISTRSQSQQQNQAQQQAQQAIDQSVDSHYQRAAELAASSGISPEAYQQADFKVRSLIDNVFPKKGDLITDQLISTLGEGSEKVMYFLGRNETAQAELQNALLSDPTGVKAAVYLGRKSAEIATPKKKVSRAPKPLVDVSGDENITAGARKMKEAYTKAHKAGDSQGAWNARKRAKASGVDVSNW